VSSTKPPFEHRRLGRVADVDRHEGDCQRRKDEPQQNGTVEHRFSEGLKQAIYDEYR
jgi:hypothetical protein